MPLEDVVATLKHYPLYVPARLLWRMLGFESYASFSRAEKRGALPFELKRFTGRRGLFALRVDIDRWLETVLSRESITNSEEDCRGRAA